MTQPTASASAAHGVAATAAGTIAPTVSARADRLGRWEGRLDGHAHARRGTSSVAAILVAAGA